MKKILIFGKGRNKVIDIVELLKETSTNFDDEIVNQEKVDDIDQSIKIKKQIKNATKEEVFDIEQERNM